MSGRRATLIALCALFVLRHDFWWWADDTRWLGVPVGLAWQVLICVGVAAAMALFAPVDGAEDDEGPA